MESLSSIESALIALGSTALLFTLAIQAGAYRVLCRQSKPNAVLPPISILKPLKGADEQLLRNLASIATQDYPHFEILFGCADADDPALIVARRIQATFPYVAIRIFVTRRFGAVNPKVSNLIGLGPTPSLCHEQQFCVAIDNATKSAAFRQCFYLKHVAVTPYIASFIRKPQGVVTSL